MTTVTVAVDMMGGDPMLEKKVQDWYTAIFGMKKEKRIIPPEERAVQGISDLYTNGDGENIRVLAVGKKEVLEEIFHKQGLEHLLGNQVEIIHAPAYFAMDGKIVNGGRNDTSLVKALKLHKEGNAQGVLSAGNTMNIIQYAATVLGRLTVGERLLTMKPERKHKIRLPLLVAFMPKKKIGGYITLADAGASVDVSAQDLYDFALMSSVYAEQVQGLPKYRLGLLSNGEEESKGNEVLRDALKLIKKDDELSSHLFGCGYVEPEHMFNDDVDVVVCDGYTGNVALKMGEAAGEVVRYWMKNDVMGSKNPLKKVTAMFGYLCMKWVFDDIKHRIDPNQSGGAPVLGIDGEVVVLHGKSSPLAFYHGIRRVEKAVRADVKQLILERYK